MNTIKIKVKKSAVIHRVMMTTAWQGVKNSEAATQYDKVAVVEADLPLLETFWREGCADIDQRLQEWLCSDRCFFAEIEAHADAHSKAHANSDTAYARSYLDVDDYEAVLLLPNNWDDSQEGALKQSLEDFLTAMMLSRWMAMTMPEQRERFVDDARQAMDAVLQILWSRKRPKAWIAPTVAKDVNEKRGKERP